MAGDSFGTLLVYIYSFALCHMPKMQWTVFKVILKFQIRKHEIWSSLRNTKQPTGMQWGSWLRHYITIQKVADSTLDGVTGIFHRHNSSSHNMALGSTNLPAEMSTRNISWGVKVAGAQGWPYQLHVSLVMKAWSLNLLETSGPVQGLITSVARAYAYIRWHGPAFCALSRQNGTQEFWRNLGLRFMASFPIFLLITWVNLNFLIYSFKVQPLYILIQKRKQTTQSWHEEHVLLFVLNIIRL